MGPSSGPTDVSGAAVPEQLHSSFLEEPRWVDMRFARDETDLDLKDPRFADAVADIASALRGIPKDELASEEVKQHRRTIRTAWGAGGLVGLLAIAAIGLAIQSANNAERAETEAARANSATLEQSIPLPSVSDIHWFDESTVLVRGTDGLWARVSIKTRDLITLATANLTRSFTAEECATYRIDPCPTFEEIRSRWWTLPSCSEAVRTETAYDAFML